MKKAINRIVAILLLLPGLAAPGYVIAILSLFYLTEARHRSF